MEVSISERRLTCVGPCGFKFQRFMTGCRRRMGQDWRPNRTISMEIMGKLLKQVEENVEDRKVA